MTKAIDQGELSLETPEQFSNRLNLPFVNHALVGRALTHRSFVNEYKEALEDNERLEFLGDAVLDFLVGAWLYHRFPEMHEGELTRLRSGLVRTEQLAEFARSIRLGDALRLGRGESNAGGRQRQALLCGAFEALIGALFIEAGLAAVSRFIEPMLGPAVRKIISEHNDKDAKSLAARAGPVQGLSCPALPHRQRQRSRARQDLRSGSAGGWKSTRPRQRSQQTKRGQKSSLSGAGIIFTGTINRMPARLKSLELHGYKTFANRTLFEFSDAVTAIVGPNGSGKSNIADSLRWVLGEQSYSLLRAKKTEDMIFSGSENRTRAGMASASITFDNSDGWLPIDFSEVAITRRAYRDGQNEYLINGQRMRLKDVSELLAQSGLAERTYTVIGQGLVDAALSLKAEERRRLFEEAAGIGLHRSRREEALRRLENTRRNLERVQDILAELQPRLRSLERQARRFQEYEQVRTDLQEMLREWYGYHWHSSQAELTQAREAARVQETRLEKTRQEQSGLNDQLAALRHKVQALRLSLNDWHREMAKFHNRREAINRDLAVAEERVRAIIEQQAAVQTQQSDQEQEYSLYQERQESARQEVTRLESELADARQQAAAARKNLEERQQQRSAVENELRLVRQEIGSLNGRQGQYQARLSERQTQRQRSLQALENAEKALEKSRTETDAAEKRLLQARQAEETARKASQEAQAAYDAHRQRTQGIEKERRQAAEKRAAAAADLAKINAQLGVLEQAEASLTGYASGTRILLEASRKQTLSGAKGALSRFLQAPAELELAISAALGDYLDAVVLDAEPEEALDLLFKQSGRGVVLPLKYMTGSSPVSANIQSDPDILGLASQLVKTAPEAQAALDALLGRTWITRDRQSARRALQGQPEGARAVTLRGEVFYASGPVHVYGSNEQSGSQTLLGRNRQRKELSVRQEEVAADLTALDQSLQKLEQEWKNHQAREQQLNLAQQNARRELDKSAAAKNQTAAALEQVRRQSHWQEEQLVRLRKDMTSDDAEAARLSQELAGLESLFIQAREKQRVQSALLETFALDEQQSNLGHWNTLAAVSERALSDAQSRLQERQTALLRLEKNQQSLLAQQQVLQQSLETFQQQKSSLHDEETLVGEGIKVLQTQIDPAEADLVQVEAEQTVLENEEAVARQSLNLAEHTNAQTRINLARRQESLATLRHRIEDDFGLVAFEYVEQVSGPTPLPLEGMVEQLPKVEKLSNEIEEAIKRQRAQLRRIGAINPDAQVEYLEVKQRFEFMTEQVADLQQAEGDVRQVIAELDSLMEHELLKTFQAVAVEFKSIFTRLFGGGSARLLLTDPDDMTNTGIDIEARLPGRRTQGLSLLSGGERSLTATALIFSLLKVSPTPFCVLDEVDAMLDEANVGRFRELLRELSQNTQFVIVTHNRNTVQVADVIYGVTMGRDSASQVLSLKLDEVSKVVTD